MRRSLIPLVLAWGLASASPCAAQSPVRPTDHGRDGALAGGSDRPPGAARLAGAEARRDSDGRVLRAWSFGIVARGADPEGRARAFLFDDLGPSVLALAPDARLALERVVTARGATTVRFVRTAFGGPVLGSSVVVRMRGDVVDYVDVSFASAPLGGSTRRVSRDRAGRLALAGSHLLGQSAGRALSVTPAALEMDERVIPVWVADVAGAHLHERQRLILDARDGRLITARPLATDALGRVYPSNPITDDGVTTDVELPHLTSRDRITGRYFRTMSCNAGSDGCEPVQLALADAAGDFLHDPDEPSFEDPFAEVQAYHHASRVAQYFRDTHGFSWTCGTAEVMRVVVNYSEQPGVAYDNAAFSPSTGSECGFMLFGQGAAHDFAYDGDVIYHEYGHAVVDQTSGLGFFLNDAQGVSYEPSAINEGTADYFAATVSGDPRMAEYFTDMASGAGEGALRRLDNELVCPDDLVGEGHFDGRIWAALGWELREALGAEKTDALMYGTMVALATLPSLAAATDTLLATAASLEAGGILTADDRAVIEATAEARGLVGCVRVAPLDEGAIRTGYSGTGQITASAGGSIAPISYRIDVPADASRLTLRIDRLTLGGTFHLYTRVGTPIRFVGSRTPPLIADADYEPDAAGRVVITRETTPPLARCETLYIAVVTEDLRTVGQALYQIRAELERTGLDDGCVDPGPDAGPEPADAGAVGADAGVETPDGGCGCRAGAGPTGRGWLAMALALGLAIRRRGAARAKRRPR